MGHRCDSDPALLGLWRGLAAAAPIRPLAWELPYAMGVALKKEKREVDHQVTWTLGLLSLG